MKSSYGGRLVVLATACQLQELYKIISEDSMHHLLERWEGKQFWLISRRYAGMYLE
jgi:hypothetical protein